MQSLAKRMKIIIRQVHWYTAQPNLVYIDTHANTCSLSNQLQGGLDSR